MQEGSVDVKARPTFPNEIQDRILDFLHGCKPDLQTCALVCKAWVPTSRYHLFSHIMLSEKNADDFEEVLENSNCTIRSCLRLEVRGSTTYSAATRMAKTLRCILTLSPSSLLLKFWPILDLRTLATVAHCSPNSIEHLFLGEFNFTDVYDLDGLLVNFPNVRELHMDDCILDRNTTPYTRGVLFKFTPQLHSLKLSRCKVDSFLRYFLRGRIAPTHLLSIKGVTYGDVSVVGEYFSMVGNVLQEIQIAFRHNSYQDVLGAFCKRANLECLTALQHLSIVVGFFYSTLPSNFIALLASILDQIPSSNLTKVCFGIPMVDSSAPRIEEWHQIGEVVQNKFSQLKELVFMLEEHAMGQPYGNVESWIREDLRALEQRGILSVR